MTLIAEIVLVALAGLAVAGCVALLPGSRPPRGGRRARSLAPHPAQLVALERLVITAGTSTVQAHAYLRPLLVEIASHRLAAHGQTLQRMPDETGRAILGERLWEIVRPDRPFPSDRHTPGIQPQDLAAMLDVLERL